MTLIQIVTLVLPLLLVHGRPPSHFSNKPDLHSNIFLENLLNAEKNHEEKPIDVMKPFIGVNIPHDLKLSDGEALNDIKDADKHPDYDDPNKIVFPDEESTLAPVEVTTEIISVESTTVKTEVAPEERSMENVNPEEINVEDISAPTTDETIQKEDLKNASGDPIKKENDLTKNNDYMIVPASSYNPNIYNEANQINPSGIVNTYMAVPNSRNQNMYQNQGVAHNQFVAVPQMAQSGNFNTGPSNVQPLYALVQVPNNVVTQPNNHYMVTNPNSYPNGNQNMQLYNMVPVNNMMNQPSFALMNQGNIPNGNAPLYNQGNNYNQNIPFNNQGNVPFNNQGNVLFNNMGNAPFNNQGSLLNNQGSLLNDQGSLLNNQGSLLNNHGNVPFNNQGSLLNNQGNVPFNNQGSLLNNQGNMYLLQPNQAATTLQYATVPLNNLPMNQQNLASSPNYVLVPSQPNIINQQPYIASNQNMLYNNQGNMLSSNQNVVPVYSQNYGNQPNNVPGNQVYNLQTVVPNTVQNSQNTNTPLSSYREKEKTEDASHKVVDEQK